MALQYANAMALISLCFLCCSWASASADVHDLLTLYNLPKGLLPKEIKSYSLSNTDNSFTIELSSQSCYVFFDDQLVYYDKIIKGKLGFGQVTGVSGIEAKKFLIWVSITEIDVDEANHAIRFNVGAINKELPAKDFDTIPTCSPKPFQRPLSSLQMEAFI